jgi:hypothetical protein
MGHLDVVVPPDFVNEDTSGDVMVPEGGTVKLTCRARGYPIPHVLWRREDNVDLVIKEPSGVKTKGKIYSQMYCFSRKFLISLSSWIVPYNIICIFSCFRALKCMFRTKKYEVRNSSWLVLCQNKYFARITTYYSASWDLRLNYITVFFCLRK